MLAWTQSHFKDHSIDSPRLTAEILLAHSLNLKRLDLYLNYDRPLQQNELAAFKKLIRRRRFREPVAYITGQKGFFESDFKVGPNVLIPRPETEILVETALRTLRSASETETAGPLKVLELGTGSGAIVVSLAKAEPHHCYVAGDISFAALTVAAGNDARIAGGKIHFFVGDWFSPLKSGSAFDLIVSNPPYIPAEDIQTLEPEVKSHEPILALDGGRDGLDCFRDILGNAHSRLSSGGTILLEMGFDQRAGIETLFRSCPEYESIDFIKDLSGHDRVVKIKKSIDKNKRV